MDNFIRYGQIYSFMILVVLVVVTFGRTYDHLGYGFVCRSLLPMMKSGLVQLSMTTFGF